MPTNDEKLVLVMNLEFQLLFQALGDLEYFIVKNSEDTDDKIKVMLYHSYARVLFHLYEFQKSCVVRLKSKTQAEDNSVVEGHIISELERIISGKGLQIERASLVKFAEDLRKYRNKSHGHVTKEKLEEYSLVKFYNSNHTYVVLLLNECLSWWKQKSVAVASHEAIQEFSKLLNFGKDISKLLS